MPSSFAASICVTSRRLAVCRLVKGALDTTCPSRDRNGVIVFIGTRVSSQTSRAVGRRPRLRPEITHAPRDRRRAAIGGCLQIHVAVAEAPSGCLAFLNASDIKAAAREGQLLAVTCLTSVSLDGQFTSASPTFELQRRLCDVKRAHVGVSAISGRDPLQSFGGRDQARQSRLWIESAKSRRHTGTGKTTHPEPEHASAVSSLHGDSCEVLRRLSR